MPAPKSRGRAAQADIYANIIQSEVTMSAANALTFQEINIGASIFDKIGMLIHRIEYVPSAGTISELTTTADYAWFGLGSSNQPTDMSADDRSIIDYKRIRFNIQTSGMYERVEPILSDFASLPNLGTLCAPSPLYLWMDTSGFSAAAGVVARIYFTILRLTDVQYLELIETRRFFG